MKILLTSVVCAAVLISVTPKSYADDSMALRICEYVQANDKQRLRKFLKKQKIKIRNIYDDLRCNGDNLLIFGAKASALDVGEFIIGQLPTKKVAADIESLDKHSKHLAAKAKERVGS
ncbi:hypothetical protein tinsulaeT_32950 [Thalassotalea insulae]|uniref:DUF3718 domain-containing protein n=1 Tax=Thalassotalea insulae TaxID=2056778 RepID=A0ABQ6GYY2_9GAMM|nr:DUF3718 domain-containing protein [Thalassotalea insulae]GLX79955.1 hypothetical protein tinsulaeT_32950 [Thalassotalea insulae]